MILDFLDPDVGTELTADVCIIGAGIAGLAIAHSLLGTGTDVLVVESGGSAAGEGTEVLNRATNVGLPLRVEEGRARVFGGTGTLWPGQCIRLDPSDFEQRSWVPYSGWPVDSRELAPFYDRAEAWLGIPAKASDERAWERFGLTPPDFDPELLTHKAASYSPHPDVGAHYRQDFERADTVRVLLHATAAGISAADGVAESLEIRTLTGRVGHVRARTFVLCGGGIENARQLLLSGIGTEHDVVGRYFHEHPVIWVDLESEREKELQRFYGLLGRGKVRYGPRLAPAPAAQESRRLLHGAASVIYDHRVTPGVAAARKLSGALQTRRWPEDLTPAEAAGSLRELGRVLAAGFQRFVLGRPSATPTDRIQLKIYLEQAPDPDSRVHLSSEQDQLGLPKAVVDWRLSELDRRSAREIVDLMDAEFRRVGLGRVTGAEWLDDDRWTKHLEDAYHPMGSTRMSADPTTGVVDADCRVHGMGNLYVSGSSVFPTGGYANPTLTIVALALRLADHLQGR